MPFTLTMPKLSPTMNEGTIVKWHIKTGDFVKAGDVLLDVATDKATVEYEAIDEGWLRQILVSEGSEALVNQPIAVLSLEKEENIEGYQPQGISPAIKEEENEGESVTIAKGKEMKAPVAAASPQRAAEGVYAQPQFTPEEPLQNYSFEYPTGPLEQRILASPLAKKQAAQKGLDLTTVKGTGPNGRVMSRDLAKAEPRGLSSFGRREQPTLAPGAFEEHPLSPLRKVIAQRLQASKSFIPHFYVTQVIDAEPLTTLREQLKIHEVKLTINDFIARACAIALRQHPLINSGFNSVSQSIIQFKTVDLAIAVSLEDGLITPIIRHADFKNLGEISLEVRLLAQRAKEGKLQPHEYKGGSFTLSNLGMYGVTEFQAIINPPQAAILAVSGIQEVPVIREGAVVPGKTMHLTLSVDHRVIDGAQAAKFLVALKKILENPSVLLLP